MRWMSDVTVVLVLAGGVALIGVAALGWPGVALAQMREHHHAAARDTTSHHVAAPAAHQHHSTSGSMPGMDMPMAPAGWTAAGSTLNNGAPNGGSLVTWLPSNPGGSQTWTWTITMNGGGTELAWANTGAWRETRMPAIPALRKSRRLN